MILGYPLSQFCFEPWHSGQLILYTIKWSIFSLISSYDTTMEQISVIRQLMELYIIQNDEFHYGSVMLELGVALHSLGDKDLEEEKWVYCLCVFWFSVWRFVLHLGKWLWNSKNTSLAWSQSVTCSKGKGTFNRLFKCYNVIQGYMAHYEASHFSIIVRLFL